ncbi:serine/threonine protein kinase [Saprolegnia parasitica CBS 223.65]|uniref:Serine/threonine protein kinase n=1 Tax=Saprolegnia parasitica (strain CBS 223.65) TaxID=695850 RepID=A0A067CJI7_SAPPC|nr:serine/threonine protein kinase [Saprolegnia parasitica CBS 223.65]KDO30909.1 serine/threonine protein kinase [Saprolegnia parasitica CBS 223.65]|eukprot:XP_012198601.1 serine/threonine protein kinase [Saprolegnia parasitica CBS 223.65]
MGNATSNESGEGTPIPHQIHEVIVKQLKAKIAALERDHAKQIENIRRSHRAEIERITSVHTAETEVAAATALEETQRRQKLEETVRAHETALLTRRLEAIHLVSDAGFEAFQGNLGFDTKAFPNTSLHAGRLADGMLVLRLADSVDRFRQSIAIMQALNGADDHLLCLVGGCDLNTDNPIAYIEYFPGTDLESYLQEHPALSEREKLQIARQIATALVAVHKKAMLHRDLNWSRVFIAIDGRVKVFVGLKARERPTGNVANGVSAERWGAPETLHATGMSSDKIDIFSLGLLLITLVTKAIPFSHIRKSGTDEPIDDDTLQQRLATEADATPMLTQPFGDASPAYAALAHACIAYDPAHRPTASEVARRLQEQLDELDEKEANVPKQATTVRPVVGIDVVVKRATGLVSSSKMYCTVSIADGMFKALATDRASCANGIYSWQQTLSFANVKPLEGTLDFTLWSVGYVVDAKEYVASIMLADLLHIDGQTTSLHAPRTTSLDLFSGGERQGSLEIQVTFTSELRKYLALYVDEKSKLISYYATRQTNYCADYARRRDLAAVVLGVQSP